MGIQSKDLIDLDDLSKAEIEEVLTKAREMRMILVKEDKKHPVLKGRSVINLFYENKHQKRTVPSHLLASSAVISSHVTPFSAIRTII